MIVYKAAIVVAALGFVFASATDSYAKKGGHGMSPGHKMQKFGSVPGYPGASGYAPGQVKKMRRGYNARAYAPRLRIAR
jgi:hypothetical protein